MVWSKSPLSINNLRLGAVAWFLKILLPLLLVSPAFAQWVPEKDSVGYTYYSSGLHRAYPVSNGYFVVYYLGEEAISLPCTDSRNMCPAQSPIYQYVFEDGQVFYHQYAALYHLRSGAWYAYTKEDMLGGMLKEFQTFWQAAYDESLKHPGHMFYMARSLAAKQIFDTAKRIASR